MKGHNPLYEGTQPFLYIKTLKRNTVVPNGLVPNGLDPNGLGNGEPERAEMGAKRPISQRVFKKRGKKVVYR